MYFLRCCLWTTLIDQVRPVFSFESKREHILTSRPKILDVAHCFGCFHIFDGCKDGHLDANLR